MSEQILLQSRPSQTNETLVLGTESKVRIITHYHYNPH